MPTYAYSTLNELVAYLQAQIGPNGNQEITGQKHQDVVVTIALSLVNIVSSIPPSTVNQFPAYDADQVYAGGVEVIVRHANKLWLFVNATDQVGVTPGTNGLVWQEISAAQLAHFRNHDTMLDEGGSNQVTAAELRSFLDAPAAGSNWVEPFDEFDATPPATPDPELVYLVDVGATGAWSGHDLSLARYTNGAWSYTPLEDGAVSRWRGGSYLVYVAGGAIVLYDLDQISNVPPPPLSTVLGAGASSGANIPILERGFHLSSMNMSHGATGTVSLDPTTTSCWYIGVEADIEVDIVPGAANGMYLLQLYSTSASPVAVSWGIHWRVPDGITMPSTLNQYDVVTVLCSSAHRGGPYPGTSKMEVLTVTKRNGV